MHKVFIAPINIRIRQHMLGLCFWLVLGLQAFTATAKGADDHDVKAIVNWVKTKDGGIFHDNLEVRKGNPGDPESPVGMYATGDIPRGEVLMAIPQEILVTAGNDTNQEYGGLWCPTVFNLIQEMRLGNQSKYAPYVNYLLTQPHGQIPSAWSKAGQDLLLEVVGQADDDDENDLPPEDVTGWLSVDWYQFCNGTDDPFDQNAAMLLVQRGWDDLMIPLFDVMSHRNGKWLNAEYDSIQRSDQPIVVRASRDISAEEQIYTSYNDCRDCGNRDMGYGTPEILREHGFIEQYPQRWFFSSYLSFELDEDDSGNVHLTWLSKSPAGKEEVNALLKHLERLGELEEVKLAESAPLIPKQELDVIVSYLQAMVNAMTLALHNLEISVGGFNCESGGGSRDVAIRYDDLGWREDDVDYVVYTCDTDKSMSYEGFEVVESLHSHYQKLAYVKDPRNDNVCFDISNIIQMCGSYRPHYHEMVVHYTARFLNKVERVMFVGGGDSMLLHDILKYPSLELVVGLELDQLVTRFSYKHFGTQPHFDNEKVQWWFGDAAKSLLMLPEEYFGSFDMVLVDLSETVMSFLVTDGLDIFQALSLLLKPNGIMVKNELYLEQMSSIFDYSIQIHFPHVPVMCSQGLILGSNKVDFLWDEITDHTVENLYIKPQAEIEDRYEYFHDYRRNSTSEHLCKAEGSPEAELTEQKRSPGILMVIEVEKISMQLTNAEKVATELSEAIEMAGFGVMASETYPSTIGAVITLVLREGYVMVRMWPDQKYCAIDIHLWSSFEKHEGAKKAVVATLGSTSPSSYRIVAGGMFGVSTWIEDDKKRGPRVVDTCNQGGEDHERDRPMKAEIASTIFGESLKLIQETDVKIAVICGARKEDCQTLEILETVAGIHVVPLISCTDSISEFGETAVEHMKACEKDATATMMETISGGKQIRAMIIDPSAPLLFTRVIYKVFKTWRNKLFDKRLFTGIAIMFDETESWRRNVLERFRSKIIDHDPCLRAEVLFNSTESMVELDVLSSGDALFVSRLKGVVSGIEKVSGLVSDVRDIKGGPFVEDPDWKPSHFFAPEDYDQSGPLKQWQSQQPLGFQTIFQLEATVSHSNLGISPESLLTALREIMNDMESGSRHATKDMRQARFHQVGGTGLGCVIVALWPGGNCVALWDGVSHVDLNLFLYSEDFDMADGFSLRFKSKFSEKFTTALKDTQPRGIGRVVNFGRDIEPRSKPHWARFRE